MGTYAHSLISSGRSREDALQIAGASYDAQNAGYRNETVRRLATLGPSFGLAWHESAFAVIEPSHALAASLMATTVPRDIEPAPITPWRCFAIAVPDGLLAGTEDLPSPGHIIVLKSFFDSAIKTLVVSKKYGISHFGTEPSLMGYADLEFVPGENEDLNAAGVSFAHRRMLLLGRLIVGTCIELDSKIGETATAAHPSSIKRKRGLPTNWTFKLTRKVNADVKSSVYAFSAGQTKSMKSVQVLVRGHHKRQAHGPNLSERKWVHIEPYWRGPEDAPIATRAHLLG